MSQSKPTNEQANTYAQAFIKHGNQTKAFKSAFPDSTATPNSLKINASKLHKLTNVQLTVLELQKEAEAIAKDEFKWEANARLKILKAICDDGMEAGEYGMRGRSDAIRAINEANKMTGEHAAEKKDFTSGGEKLNNWIIHPVEKVK